MRLEVVRYSRGQVKDTNRHKHRYSSFDVDGSNANEKQAPFFVILKSSVGIQKCTMLFTLYSSS